MKRFPISGGPSVLWSFIEPHEGQALKNHNQSLQRLAERGGLCPTELFAVVNGLGWRDDKLPTNLQCLRWLNGIISKEQEETSELHKLRESVRRLVGEWETMEAQCKENAEGRLGAVIDKIQGATFKMCREQLSALIDGKDGGS